MSESDLIARACDTNAHYLALGNERFEAHDALFIRNSETPRRYDANHVGLIRTSTPADVEALITRADAEYASFNHRRFDIDPLTPPLVEARLVLDGVYTRSEGIHLLLENDLRTKPPPVAIREVRTALDWAAYDTLDRLWWQETRDEVVTDTVMYDASTQKRLKSQQGVRYWLACIEEEPRAFLASWPGENGVGMVEDLFTHPDYRHRGLATALIAHCVADARARGAGPVLIGADPNDTPKQMYAAMGFRPLFVARSYFRELKA